MNLDNVASVVREALSSAAAAFARLVAWTPDWAIGFLVLAAAVVAALAVHAVVVGLMRRAIAPRSIFLKSLVARTSGPTRLALVILALRAALQYAAFAPGVSEDVGHLLVIAIVALVGWIAAIAVTVAADVYLLRFKTDAPDDLLARKHMTQVRILQRAMYTLTVVVTVSWGLMTFDSVRQYGVSLFASAGIAGVIVGLAARPLLSNLIAGVQIAVTQPIRLGDAVVVANEWGWIEEIAATYVVIRIWDERRLIVPLSYFMENIFQNWTRDTSAIIGAVTLQVDYAAPVARIRDKLTEIVSQSKLWDRHVVNLQVTDCRASTIELRALMSAATSPAAWDLRCEVREKLIAFLQREYPEALPRRRGEVEVTGVAGSWADERGRARVGAA